MVGPNDHEASTSAVSLTSAFVRTTVLPRFQRGRAISHQFPLAARARHHPAICLSPVCRSMSSNVLPVRLFASASQVPDNDQPPCERADQVPAHLFAALSADHVP